MVVRVNPLELHKESRVSPRLFIKYLMLFFNFSVFSFLCIEYLPLCCCNNPRVRRRFSLVAASYTLDSCTKKLNFQADRTTAEGVLMSRVNPFIACKTLPT